MNFDEAIKAHYEWKDRLLKYMANPDGTLNPDLIGRDDVCVLGRWLHGDGKRYIHLREINELMEEHRVLHKMIAEILIKGAKSEKVRRQLQSGPNGEFQKSAANITYFLNRLKNLIR